MRAAKRERRFGDVERTRERLATIDRVAHRPGTTRRMVERVRAGPSLRAARPAAQARLRARRRPHARPRHRRERGDVRHRRSPALPSAGVHRSRRTATHHIYFGRVVDGKEFVGNSCAVSTLSRPHARLEDDGSARRRSAGSAPRDRRRRGRARNRDRRAERESVAAVRRAPGDRSLLHRRRGSRARTARASSCCRTATGSRSTPARATSLGKTMDIGPAKYTIIGVAPRGFRGRRRW